MFCREGKVLHNLGMLTLLQSKWTPRFATILVSLLAIGSAAYWVQRLSTERGLQVSAAALVADAAVLIDPANVARMLGAKAATVAAEATQASLASRFALRGVLAGGKDGWAALISVDGKPAQPVRVGGVVADNLVLQSVAGKTALLGAERTGNALVTLNLPEPKAGDNQRATERGNAQPDNPEMPSMGGRNPEMGQEQAEIDRNARRRLERLESRRRNSQSNPVTSQADAEALRMMEQINRNRQPGVGGNRNDMNPAGPEMPNLQN